MREILISLAISILLLIPLINFVPSSEDLDPRNPYWNGLKNFSAIPTKSLEIESSKALLIISPEKEFSAEEVEKIRRFVENGGLLVVADEFGNSNSLLSQLNLNAKFNGSEICDKVFRYRSEELPLAFSKDLVLVLNKATFIEGDVKGIAKTSEFSFVCESKESGPFIVAGEVEYGKGKVVLISDSSIFTNSMLGFGNNSDFLKKIFERETFVYIAKRSLLSEAKDFVSFLMQSFEFRYSYIALFALMILKFRIKKREESEFEKLIKENPDWDKELLRRLENERNLR
ncbi:MAG: DUF4350 domain-containing protein [Archaeoglobaceae archaeon]